MVQHHLGGGIAFSGVKCFCKLEEDSLGRRPFTRMNMSFVMAKIGLLHISRTRLLHMTMI
jgi:hypothetical protein